MATFALGPLRSTTGRSRYVRDVRRVIDYLFAGDAYQVNLAHELRGTFSGSTRALAADLFGRVQPRHGAYLELPGEGGRRRAVVSLSPELFLEVEPASGPGAARRIRTRPMKGTRPLRASGMPGTVQPSIAAADLWDSEKDQAELNMIIDLMRNDLSRVCALPSVRVARSRDVEDHGYVAQATGTVEGWLREGADLSAVLQATFPGGSVTGAPKIRAMQIIDELEPIARGPYCGSIALIRPGGTTSLNIAIRTLVIEGEAGAKPGEIERGTISYSVGAGVTVASDPEAEWEETLDKAALVLGLSGTRREDV